MDLLQFLHDSSRSMASSDYSILKVLNFFCSRTNIKFKVRFIEGILQLWKDECVFKMGHLCSRNVIYFYFYLEPSRLRKARKCILGSCG